MLIARWRNADHDQHLKDGKPGIGSNALLTVLQEKSPKGILIYFPGTLNIFFFGFCLNNTCNCCVIFSIKSKMPSTPVRAIQLDIPISEAFSLESVGKHGFGKSMYF